MTEQSKSTFATINPATGRTVAEFPQIEGKEVDVRVQAAHLAFGEWRARSVEDRAAAVGRAA